jgi:lipid A 4'-phosphatase
MKKFNIIFLASSTLAGLLFYCIPDLDLTVARFLFIPKKGFVLDSVEAAKLLQLILAYLTATFVTVCLALLTINNMSLLRRVKAGFPLQVSNRSVIYLLLALALGPGLVVNVFFKENWGRARPRAIVEFGGTKQFTRAFVLSDQCDNNCSFVSGEASLGFYGLAFIFVARRRRKTIAFASLLAGSLIGFLRMSLGAHFLSDVIFSGVFTFLVSYLLAWCVLRPGSFSLASSHQKAPSSRRRSRPAA